MAFDLKQTKKTRHPGVYRTPDGRLLVRIAVVIGGKQRIGARLLDADATEGAAVLAREALKKELADRDAIKPVPRRSAQTVADYARNWLAIRSARLKPSTRETYEEAINSRIVPQIGHVPCADVSRQVVESWVVWAQAQTRTVGKGKDQRQLPYSQDSMRAWWRTLATMLRDMAADHDLQDPTRRVRPPERPELAPVREQRTLDVREIGRLLDLAREHFADRYAEIATLALTGMRAGEVYALRWDCVDASSGKIVVRRSVSGGVVSETTKTKSQRTVPLHPQLASVLADHRNRQIRKGNKAVLSSGLVFPSNAGTPRTANTLDKPFEALQEMMGTDVRLGAQVLRRSMNTNLVQAQVDRLTVRAILGHTSEEMTARYFGVAEDRKIAAVAALALPS